MSQIQTPQASHLQTKWDRASNLAVIAAHLYHDSIPAWLVSNGIEVKANRCSALLPVAISNLSRGRDRFDGLTAEARKKGGPDLAPKFYHDNDFLSPLTGGRSRLLMPCPFNARYFDGTPKTTADHFKMESTKKFRDSGTRIVSRWPSRDSAGMPTLVGVDLVDTTQKSVLAFADFLDDLLQTILPNVVAQLADMAHASLDDPLERLFQLFGLGSPTRNAGKISRNSINDLIKQLQLDHRFHAWLMRDSVLFDFEIGRAMSPYAVDFNRWGFKVKSEDVQEMMVLNFLSDVLTPLPDGIPQSEHFTSVDDRLIEYAAMLLPILRNEGKKPWEKWLEYERDSNLAVACRDVAKQLRELSKRNQNLKPSGKDIRWIMDYSEDALAWSIFELNKKENRW